MQKADTRDVLGPLLLMIMTLAILSAYSCDRRQMCREMGHGYSFDLDACITADGHVVIP